MSFLLAQISDLHVVPDESELGQQIRTIGFVQQAVTRLMEMDPRPDAVVATGDLVDAGSREEYELLRELFEPLSIPLYLVAGNHDERDTLREVFARTHSYLPPRGFLHYSVDLGPLVLVVLDTVVAGEPGGRLCEERLQFLDSALAAAKKPVIVAQHHPPFVTGMRCMDEMGLAGEEEAAIVAKYPKVKRVLCGHLHRNITRSFANTFCCVSPSTCHSVELDLRTKGRLAVRREPPACLLHLWREDEVVTHHSFLGDFGDSHVIPYD